MIRNMGMGQRTFLMDAPIAEIIKTANQKVQGAILGPTARLTKESGGKEKGMGRDCGTESMERFTMENGGLASLKDLGF